MNTQRGLNVCMFALVCVAACAEGDSVLEPVTPSCLTRVECTTDSDCSATQACNLGVDPPTCGELACAGGGAACGTNDALCASDLRCLQGECAITGPWVVFADAVCARVARCANFSAEEKASCVDRIAMEASPACGGSFDQAKAADCFDHMENYPCGLDPLPSSCDGYLNVDLGALEAGSCYCLRLRASGEFTSRLATLSDPPCGSSIMCDDRTCGGGGINCLDPDCPSFQERIELAELAAAADEGACAEAVAQACMSTP